MKACEWYSGGGSPDMKLEDGRQVEDGQTVVGMGTATLQNVVLKRKYGVVFNP